MLTEIIGDLPVVRAGSCPKSCPEYRDQTRRPFVSATEHTTVLGRWESR